MNAAAPATHRLRKAAALVVALLLATLAFGIGLPWIIVDAPPQAETLWAREIQSHTMPAMSLKFGVRPGFPAGSLGVSPRVPETRV